MLYYIHEQHAFMCTLQLKSSPTVDVTYICSVYSLLLQYKLFAETVLHIGQVLMLVYIKLKSRPSVTPITHLGLPTSTYQLPNIINPSSSYFKFVTASECGDQVVFCSRLKTKKWRKLEQHFIENHSHMAQ